MLSISSNTFLFLLCILCKSSISTDDCDCADKQDSYNRSASSVFAGSVKQIKDVGDTREVIFEVEMLWTGIISTEAKVITSRSDCGWDFQHEERYLVYSYDGILDGLLFTDKCTKTVQLEDVGPAVNILDVGIVPREHLEDCTYGNLADLLAGCNKRLMMVCGCNGISYQNPCLARREGVLSYQDRGCQ